MSGLGLSALAALATAGPVAAPAATQAPAPPPIKHVFVIVLENKDYEKTFAKDSKAPYLATELPKQGMVLTRYYGIGHQSLDNYIAMVSGQAPNPQTQADCQVFTDLLPGTIGADGQAIGNGCVYPASVKTVADQLLEKGLSWGGYMEDMEKDVNAQPNCRHPAIGTRDSTQSAKATDQYAARHNPFVYFHSIIDTPECAKRDVPLTRLPAALRSGDVPSFVFISPNLCRDGHDEPCVNGEPGGLVSADAFLRAWVPRITGSRAFREGGLLAVTFDEAEADDSACCVQDAPNTPNPAGPSPGPGGGRIGALLISQFIRPGTTSDTPYNHYSFLRSVEDVFGLAPLGYAGKASGFGADVYNNPNACFDHPLPIRRATSYALPRGTLILALTRKGRRVSLLAAHTATVEVRAGGRRVARRRVGPCGTFGATVPRRARSATVTARFGKRYERRRLAIH